MYFLLRHINLLSLLRMTRRNYVFSLLVLQATFCTPVFMFQQSNNNVNRIAVIGGGIGGTASAYYLKELFGDTALIDLYEPEVIGGRLAILSISGQNYEVGGSVIHPRNKYMVDLVNKFGLRANPACGGSLGLYDGNRFVFRESDWSVVNLIEMFWRYGWDVYRLRSFTEDMLSNFDSIYHLQEEGKTFDDVTSMLIAMNPIFVNASQTSTRDWLKSKGFGDLIIDELVNAVTRCNYGQSPIGVHAFVGSVSIAGADPNLWSVAGGNKRVAEILLSRSRASHLKRLVTQIEPESSLGGFVVTSIEEEPLTNYLYREGRSQPRSQVNSDPRRQRYDAVVLAVPMTADKSTLRLFNFSGEEFHFPGRYQRTVTTLVDGQIRPDVFNFTDDQTVVDEILTVNERMVFTSVGKISPADIRKCAKRSDQSVWKIFSPKPLSEDHLNGIFETRNATKVVDWLAYPHYETNQELGRFQLVPGLVHSSAIEWAASAMEMSIIGGRNAALLTFKFLRGDVPKKLLKDEL